LARLIIIFPFFFPFVITCLCCNATRMFISLDLVWLSWSLVVVQYL
jgi:hypothetical protein